MSIHAQTEPMANGAVSVAQLTLAESLGHTLAERKPRRISRESALRRLLVVTDIVALTLALVVIEFWGNFHNGQTVSVLRDVALLAFGIPMWVLLAHGHNLYHADSRRADHGWIEELMPIIQMATIWSWAILLAISMTGIRPVGIPKLAVFWGLTIVFLLVLRSATRFWARRRSWYLQNALVVGTPLQAASVLRRVLRHPEYKINVIACVDTGAATNIDEGSERAVARMVAQTPMIRGDINLPELIEQLDIQRVIFAPGAKETRDGVESLCELGEREVHVDLIPSWSDFVGRRLEFHELEGMPLLTVPPTSIRRSDLVRKRVFDVFASSIALALLSPVFLICAIAIKIDSDGPVLFRQRRVGRRDRRFEMLKFRSMYTNADGLKDEVAGLNFHGGGNVHGMFKVREDPRITRVGRWLRRTSLDELPQLLNVLKGDMSLVGPRPLIECEDRQVEGRFRRRLSSAPGLTGPWQIHGRSEIPFEEMINLDYLYVMNWSLWGDIKLMLRTVHAVLRGHGAY